MGWRGRWTCAPPSAQAPMVRTARPPGLEAPATGRPAVASLRRGAARDGGRITNGAARLLCTCVRLARALVAGPCCGPLSPRDILAGPVPPLRTGTPSYMSPEMISEGRLSPEVDIFSAGVLLHEMLSGHRAWNGLRWAARRRPRFCCRCLLDHPASRCPCICTQTYRGLSTRAHCCLLLRPTAGHCSLSSQPRSRQLIDVPERMATHKHTGTNTGREPPSPSAA